jgi:hypothetical protein
MGRRILILVVFSLFAVFTLASVYFPPSRSSSDTSSQTMPFAEEEDHRPDSSKSKGPLLSEDYIFESGFLLFAGCAGIKFSSDHVAKVLNHFQNIVSPPPEPFLS